MDSLAAAQTDLRTNYRNGATGVFISGVVWLITAGVLYNFSTKQAIWALLIGGALIHPVSTLINKLMGLKAATNQDNPLTGLAMEGTVFMLMSIPLAYGLSLLRPEWFFQGMLLIIGGRYLTFRTLYGNKLFWVLGGLLGVSAYSLFASNTHSLVTTLTGGLIEVCFGLLLFGGFSLGETGASATP
ncbi:hypothetical protein IC230_27025 [Spirosoma sp. BT704]|uniref:Uncharacterized protein n=1 Tax=Spirosoma validum TaxID=2771355 RepID=A0A927B724_9BACT|nr:hypothetical protein [Spirosoma validum]